MSSRPRLRSWTSGSAAAPRRGRLATAMDFLRIRQKARERSAERDRHVDQGGAAPGTPTAGADQPAAVIRDVAAGGPVAPVEAGDAGARAAADVRPEVPDAPVHPIARPDIGGQLLAGARAVAPDAADSIEDALRAELELAAVPDPGARATRARVEAPATPPRPLDDLLDDFFWREGEVAPTLPDLVSAAAVPAMREPVEARHEWLT